MKFIKKHQYQGVCCSEFETEFHHLLVAERNFDRGYLSEAFAGFDFQFPKQVHGDALVEATKSTKTGAIADAIWTREAKIFIGVETADCVPVFVFHKKFAMAIHAGWRGVAHQIIQKSVTQVQKIIGESSVNFQIYIGPHIRVENFEVHNDVMEKLKKSCPDQGAKDIIAPHSDPEKSFVNLSEILKHQLFDCGVPAFHINEDTRDTFDSPELASFRRDKKSAGRNTFLVALKG